MPHRTALLLLIPPVVWVSGCHPTATPAYSILQGHEAGVTSLAFAPDGTRVVSRSEDDTVRFWDVSTARELAKVDGFPSDQGVVVFSPDGDRIAANEATVGAITWDADTGASKRIYRHLVSDEPSWSCYSVSYGWGLDYSPDGKILAAGGSRNGEGGTLTLWQVDSGEAEELSSGDSPVTAVKWSPTGDSIAAANLAGEVTIWDAASKRIQSTFAARGSPMMALAYSPNGGVLAAVGPGDSVKLWDVADGEEVALFRGHRDAVRCVAFSHDGRLAASGDQGGTILLWDPSSKRIAAEFEGHEGEILCIAFSPDDAVLASGGKDRTIRLWTVPRPGTDGRP